MTDLDKSNPSQDDWLELIKGLQDAAIAGQLKSVTFALVDSRMPDNAMVDHYGSPELTEVACRMTVERIASVLQLTNMSLATAIREGMPKQRARH